MAWEWQDAMADEASSSTIASSTWETDEQNHLDTAAAVVLWWYQGRGFLFSRCRQNSRRPHAVHVPFFVCPLLASHHQRQSGIIAQIR
jgi:hypothetical protein